MGVESYYLAEARARWVGKKVEYKDRLIEVIDVVQTDGFTNPAMDFNYALILADKTKVSTFQVALQPETVQVRKVLSKLNMFIDHNGGPGKELPLKWEEVRALRDLITEMNIHTFGENIEMEVWDTICNKVDARHAD